MKNSLKQRYSAAKNLEIETQETGSEEPLFTFSAACSALNRTYKNGKLSRENVDTQRSPPSMSKTGTISIPQKSPHSELPSSRLNTSVCSSRRE